MYDAAGSLDTIGADAIELVELVAGPDAVYALLNAPTATGKELLMFGGDSLPITRLHLPAIGNSVHGYGLHSLAPASTGLVFCGSEDSMLHHLRGARVASSIRVSADGWVGDPAWHPASQTVLAVFEANDSTPDTSDRLVSIAADGSVRVLFEWSSLLARPACAPDGRIACVAWRLPFMPWERSSLWVGSMAGSFIRIPTPMDASVAQPMFAATGELYFLCDATGYFELWSFDGQRTRPVSALDADIGLSMSRQTNRSIALLPDESAAAIVWRRGVSELHKIDLASGRSRAIRTAAPVADHLTTHADRVWYATQPIEGPLELRALDASGHDELVWSAPAVPSPVSPEPMSISVVADDGEHIDMFVFPAAPERRRGILILNLHGGPHSLAPLRLRGVLRVLRDDGYDVAELNYRGSAGFGRHYRSPLRGQWGIVDVEDILAATARLTELGIATHARTVLRGSSAGAYTALNTLTQHGGFAGGVIYSAVSDLKRLGETTHRYESGFLKQLVGAADLNHPRYFQRSPLSRIDSIDAPILLLQGGADRVTPPMQAIEIAERMRDGGRRVDLHMFDNEGHGFSHPTTLRQCAQLEREFLHRIG